MHPAKTTLDCLPQMLGTAVLNPFVRPGPLETGFGCDQKIGRIWIERLSGETLGNSRPVRVGGVYEIGCQVHRAFRQRARIGMIGRLSPPARTGELPRAEAESANGNVTVD